MRMSAFELVAHHAPGVYLSGSSVTVAFGDPVVAQAFRDRLEAVVAASSPDKEEAEGRDDARKRSALSTRLDAVERELARLSEPVGAPHLRDMGATLLDKARARLLEAKADRLEKETAAEYAAPADPGPLAVHSVSVDNEERRPGERVLLVGFSDGVGRDVVIALPFALALKLNSSIGHTVADRLDAARER